MTRDVVVLATLLSSVLAPSMAAAGRCSTVSNQVKDLLVSYVNRKYQLGSVLRITVEETGIERDCYRQLRFRSVTPSRPFEIILYLSPDRKFLAPDILDVSDDPTHERNRGAAELEHRLASLTSPLLGSPSAPVTIVMFSDFQCPFCREASEFIKTEILPKNIGDVRLIVREHPLPSHNWARKASEIGICVHHVQGDGAFWKLHEYLFGLQGEITDTNLMSRALDYLSTLPGFDASQFHSCMASSFPSQTLLVDENIAQSLGITSTPTFFVNGARQVGIADRDGLKQLIEQYVRAARPLAVGR
jgi:protein-disulfide isomerase